VDLKYTQHLPSNFHSDSRVWIYQCNRQFTATETSEIDNILGEFCGQWTSHGAKVKGFGKVLFDKFIILMADETASGVSGCSTDSSVRLIKEIESRFGVSLFERENLAFFTDGSITQIHLKELEKAFHEGIINPESLYFNNTILTKKELETNWIIPMKISWLKNRITEK